MSNSDRSSAWLTSTRHCRPCTPRSDGDPATWSQYPATQNVDISCNRIVDVSGIEFCDGAIISHDSTNITVSSLPITMDTTVSAANQLIPRSYVDNLINIALPAIAGYAPGTCSNLNKNINKSSANLTSVAGNGNLYFLYPFIDTPISKVVTYTGGSTTNIIVNATFAGLSLIEYPTLSSTSGVCVATTGNVVGAPYNIWKAINTRYAIPFNTPYTLKAGFKYAVTTCHNNTSPTSTIQLLGFGMGNSTYSVGVAPYDIQTSDSYTGGIPTVGSIITGLGTGSGFAVSIQLEP